LVRNVSEAEELKISLQILDIYTAAGAAEKAAFFSAVSREFGPHDTALSERGENDLPQEDCAAKLAARFLTEAQKLSGSAADRVERFYLGNGATLLHIHPCADQSPRGIANSWGVMVNYLYDGETIQQNHQAYESHQDVSASHRVAFFSDLIDIAVKSLLMLGFVCLTVPFWTLTMIFFEWRSIIANCYWLCRLGHTDC
jgi:malonyl-CoA decarboxylase